MGIAVLLYELLSRINRPLLVLLNGGRRQGIPPARSQGSLRRGQMILLLPAAANGDGQAHENRMISSPRIPRRFWNVRATCSAALQRSPSPPHPPAAHHMDEGTLKSPLLAILGSALNGLRIGLRLTLPSLDRDRSRLPQALAGRTSATLGFCTTRRTLARVSRVTLKGIRFQPIY